MSRRLAKQTYEHEITMPAPVAVADGEAFEPNTESVPTPTPTSPAAPAEADAIETNATLDIADVVLTTKSEHDHKVVAQLAQVEAENTVMVAITPDMISNGKFTGSKSEGVQNALKQARQNALAELRKEASRIGANLVEAVEVKSGLKLADKHNAKVSVKAIGQAVQAELAETAEA